MMPLKGRGEMRRAAGDGDFAAPMLYARAFPVARRPLLARVSYVDQGHDLRCFRAFSAADILFSLRAASAEMMSHI